VLNNIYLAIVSCTVLEESWYSTWSK